MQLRPNHQLLASHHLAAVLNHLPLVHSPHQRNQAHSAKRAHLEQALSARQLNHQLSELPLNHLHLVLHLSVNPLKPVPLVAQHHNRLRAHSEVSLNLQHLVIVPLVRLPLQLLPLVQVVQHSVQQQVDQVLVLLDLRHLQLLGLHHNLLRLVNPLLHLLLVRVLHRQLLVKLQNLRLLHLLQLLVHLAQRVSRALLAAQLSRVDLGVRRSLQALLGARVNLLVLLAIPVNRVLLGTQVSQRALLVRRVLSVSSVPYCPDVVTHQFDTGAKPATAFGASSTPTSTFGGEYSDYRYNLI